MELHVIYINSTIIVNANMNICECEYMWKMYAPKKIEIICKNKHLAKTLTRNIV